jgi:hypothetical protein
MSTTTESPLDSGDQAQAQAQHTSVPHLVMGLVFLGIAGAWALHAAAVIGSVEVQWLMPTILVVAGAAGLLASLARGLARRPRKPDAEPSLMAD